LHKPTHTDSFSLTHTHTHTHTHESTHLLNTQWKTPVQHGSLRCYKSDSFHRLTTWQTTDRERKRSQAKKSKCNNRSGLMKQQIQEKKKKEGKGNNRKLITDKCTRCNSAVKRGKQLNFRIFLHFPHKPHGSDCPAVCSLRPEYYVCSSVEDHALMHSLWKSNHSFYDSS